MPDQKQSGSLEPECPKNLFSPVRYDTASKLTGEKRARSESPSLKGTKSRDPKRLRLEDANVEATPAQVSTNVTAAPTPSHISFTERLALSGIPPVAGLAVVAAFMKQRSHRGVAVPNVEATPAQVPTNTTSTPTPSRIPFTDRLSLPSNPSIAALAIVAAANKKSNRGRSHSGVAAPDEERDRIQQSLQRRLERTHSYVDLAPPPVPPNNDTARNQLEQRLSRELSLPQAEPLPPLPSENSTPHQPLHPFLQLSQSDLEGLSEWPEHPPTPPANCPNLYWWWPFRGSMRIPRYPQFHIQQRLAPGERLDPSWYEILANRFDPPPGAMDDLSRATRFAKRPENRMTPYSIRDVPTIVKKLDEGVDFI